MRLVRTDFAADPANWPPSEGIEYSLLKYLVLTLEIKDTNVELQLQLALEMGMYLSVKLSEDPPAERNLQEARRGGGLQLVEHGVHLSDSF